VKKALLLALVVYFLMVIGVFCVTLAHPPTNPCPPPMYAPWYHTDCKFSR
jgi:hypothetical protein